MPDVCQSGDKLSCAVLLVSARALERLRDKKTTDMPEDRIPDITCFIYVRVPQKHLFGKNSTWIKGWPII